MILLLPFLSDRRPGVTRGRGAPVLICVCVLVLGYLGFRVSSINVMVGRMVMVLFWNNGLPTHATARRRRRWHQREVHGAQAVGVASI
jgi:hypothetical protein